MNHTISADHSIHFFTTPQAGHLDGEKDTFWKSPKAETCDVSANGSIVIMGDFNSDVDGR